MAQETTVQGLRMKGTFAMDFLNRAHTLVFYRDAPKNGESRSAFAVKRAPEREKLEFLEGFFYCRGGFNLLALCS